MNLKIHLHLRPLKRARSMKPIFKSKILLIFILIIAIFIVFNLTGFSKEVKNFFYSISSPIQKTFWKAGDNVSDFFSVIFEMKILKEENELSRLKIQELLAKNAFLEEFKKENEFLREALNIGLEKDFQLVFSEVISKDISQDSILINKGLKDGISRGFPVVTCQKTLLGRVGEVYQDFSEVILISNADTSFDAKVSEKEIYGVIKGKGNLKLYFDLIPKDKEIFEGDLIITTILGGVFPEGLLIGLIKEIKKLDIEPWQTAEIELSFNIKDLDNLFIITNF